jgi:nitrite reductase (NADH) small subunit
MVTFRGDCGGERRSFRRDSATIELNAKELFRMQEMIRVCSESELPREGEVCEMADGHLCVARVGGEIAVLSNVCPHSEGPLGQGMIEDGKVVCPFHGWAFDVKTGVTDQSSQLKARVFEAMVKDGALLVRPPEPGI